MGLLAIPVIIPASKLFRGSRAGTAKHGIRYKQVCLPDLLQAGGFKNLN
jgi:hypothetical protein